MSNNKIINQNPNPAAADDFLPEGYEPPRGADSYLKLKSGENRLRILSKPIIGWIDWTKDNKPLRFRMNEKPAAPIDPEKPIKHFWAMVVWDYAENKVKILEITQQTIQAAITHLAKDPDWGTPTQYDLKITRSGDKLTTEYTTTPAPAKPLEEVVMAELIARPVNLEALFKGEDPFAIAGSTPPASTVASVSEEIKKKIDSFLNQPALTEWFKGIPEAEQTEELKVLVKKKYDTLLPF